MLPDLSLPHELIPTTREPTLSVTAPMARQGSGLLTSACGATDRGLFREENQDQFLLASLTGAMWIQQSSLQRQRVRCTEPVGQLMVIADGIGGQVGGGEASALAVETVERCVLGALGWLFGLTTTSIRAGDEGMLEELKIAVQRADRAVRAKAAKTPRLAQMGTTLTLAYSLAGRLYVAHVGDTRCSIFRGGALHQLTTDHTVLRELLTAGVMVNDRNDARYRHVLTNAVGGGMSRSVVEVQRADLAAGDVVLLSSDGLHDAVSTAEITGILSRELRPAHACAELVAAANAAGGRDNVTVIVARYDDPAITTH